MPCCKTCKGLIGRSRCGRSSDRENPGLWADVFAEPQADAQEYIDASNAAICAAIAGQGQTSGISIDVHQFDLYGFRDGKVVRAVLGFRSKNEALDAARLRE